ncbi:hypothetical protein GCWU000342_02197 [Shuttleworthella satelles DSM 14600]|uniref:Uncharacterized protein n=1 Tax=Shuttleworthella satelles DSM 14600 TaxID=626523 RepID=C4GDM3_9FIRM|nr:hypothetical protein GCWU000342_02197 [Shuttleworthia satelles DSM 14600]
MAISSITFPAFNYFPCSLSCCPLFYPKSLSQKTSCGRKSRYLRRDPEPRPTLTEDSSQRKPRHPWRDPEPHSPLPESSSLEEIKASTASARTATHSHRSLLPRGN